MKVSHMFPNLASILRDACKASAGHTYNSQMTEHAIELVVEAVRRSDAKDALIRDLAAETSNIHLKQMAKVLLSK